jgi:hypothetical protein
MKTNLFFLALLAAISLIFSGCCTTHTQSYSYKIWVPVYKSFDEIRNGVKTLSSHDFQNPGKIYTFGNYLFVNEKGEGIHIIDNSDHSNPKFVSFIKIPGNYDIAVKGNVLYADSYIDLLAFNISNPSAPILAKRIESLFPNPLDNSGQYADPEKGIIVEWLEKDTVYTYSWDDCDETSPISYGPNYDGGKGGLETGGGGTGTNSTNPSGKGGSMARFTLFSNYLYIVDHASLQTVDISNPLDPKEWSKINIGRGDIETVYPFKDKLFIGSMTGMYIYDVSSAWNPQYLGEFTHARACDPVVADDKYAYVTLRQGTRCGGISNQLDVLDISNLLSPKLLKSYPMQEPAGLGLDDNTLMICDGRSGLKVFNVENPLNIQLLDWESGLKTYDLIPMGSYVIVSCEDGIYQYSYTDPKNLVLLSKIPIKK